jgi:hypothetical protein
MRELADKLGYRIEPKRVSIERELAKGLALNAGALGRGFVTESISIHIPGHDGAKDFVIPSAALAIDLFDHLFGGLKGEFLSSFSRGMIGVEDARISHRIFCPELRGTFPQLVLNQSSQGPVPYGYPVSAPASVFELTSQSTPTGLN